MSWSERFEGPRRGGCLVTLKDAIRYLSDTIPKSEHDHPSIAARGGALVMRGIEFCATGLVLLGVGLPFGYLAAERVTCF